MRSLAAADQPKLKPAQLQTQDQHDTGTVYLSFALTDALSMAQRFSVRATSPTSTAEIDNELSAIGSERIIPLGDLESRDSANTGSMLAQQGSDSIANQKLSSTTSDQSDNYIQSRDNQGGRPSDATPGKYKRFGLLFRK